MPPHSSHPPCLSFSILRKRHKLEIKDSAVTTEPKASIICEELDVDSGWLFTICTEVSDCMITNLVGQHKYQKLPNLFCFLCVAHLKWEFSMSRKHEISLYVFWFVSVFCNKILLMVLNICTCKTAQTI